MAKNTGKPLDALTISELGKAFDARLKEETAEMSRVEQRVEALFEATEQRTGYLAGVLAGVEEERARLTAELAECRENLAQKRNEAVRLMFRLEQQELSSVQATQMALAESRTLFEREKAFKETAQAALAETQAQLARENSQRETTLAETQAQFARENNRLEAALTEAQSITAAAQKRADDLARNSRARESMLLETIAQVRLEESIKATRELVRAEYLSRYVELLSQPHAGSLAGISTKFSEDSRQSVSEAAIWLAEYAETALRTRSNHDFEIMAGQRWTDHTFVAAGYSWLLGRPADEAGVAHYQRLLCTGLQRRSFLMALACSQEARSRLSGLAHTLGDDDGMFVRAAYQAILGRPADSMGFDHYLAMQGKRGDRNGILLDLAGSREGRLSGTPLAAALRVISHMATPQAILRRKLIEPFEQRSARSRHAWRAGRIAVLACEANLVRQDLDARLDLLAETADRRVAQARLTATESAAPGAVLSPVVSIPPRLDLILNDSSARRTPASIRAAIRDELHAVGVQ